VDRLVLEPSHQQSGLIDAGTAVQFSR
jgi:hypothetical protein